MTKVTMPEPVAWRSKYKSEPGMIGNYPWSYVEHSLRQPALNNYDIESLVTTTQAEAYKDACVREALEALNNQAQELYESSLKSRLTRDGAADEDELKAIDLWNVESVGMAKAYTNIQKAILALIPKEDA